MTTLADLAIGVSIDDSRVSRGAKGVESKLERTWKNVKKTAALAGAAAGAALTASMVEAMDQERATDRLAGALGATGARAEQLGESAGALFSAGWGQSMGDVTGALDAVSSSIAGMADASSSELERVTTQALAFADAFEIDTARAAQVAGNVVANELAPDAAAAFDLMTSAAQKVPKQLRADVLDAADEYGQFFHTLGFSGPQAFATLAAGADKGMFGIDKAGDALKEFTIRSTDLSTATSSAFDTIGLDTETMTNQILAGGDSAQDAFGQIVDGLLAVEDPGKRAEAAIALFGTPLEDLGVTEIPQFLASLRDGQGGLDDVAGSADKLADTLSDNASTELETFKRGAQQALVEQVAKALPFLKRAGEFLGRHKDVVVPLVGALAAFAGVVGTIVAAQKAWAGIMLIVNAAMKAKLAVMAVIRGATLAWTAIQWALNVALTANPIGLIIVGIAALIAIIVLIATKTTWFQDLWSLAWGGIKAAALAVWGFIKDTLWEDGIKKYFNLMIGLAETLREKIVGALAKVVGFVQDLPGKIRKAASGMWDGIKNAFKSAINWVIGKWNGLSFTLPSVTAFGKTIGGATLSTPNIPRLAAGGIVTEPTIAMLGEAGQDEAVVPLPRGMRDLGGDGVGSTTLVLRTDGSRASALLAELLREALRTNPGFRAEVRAA